MTGCLHPRRCRITSINSTSVKHNSHSIASHRPLSQVLLYISIFFRALRGLCRILIPNQTSPICSPHISNHQVAHDKLIEDPLIHAITQGGTFIGFIVGVDKLHQEFLAVLKSSIQDPWDCYSYLHLNHKNQPFM